MEDDDDRYTGVMSQRPEATNEDSYLRSGRPSRLLRASFSCARLETLYRASSLQQRCGGLQCFLTAAILYGFYALASEPDTPVRCFTAVFLCFNIGAAWVIYGTRARNALSVRTWTAVSHVVWKVWVAQLFAQLFLKTVDVTPRDNLGWWLLLLYLLFATLPLRLAHCVLLALGTALVYIITVVGLSKSPEQIPYDVLVGNA